jgi:hypothetical protein
MAQVIISYEEYQDLLASKSKREESLEKKLNDNIDSHWLQVNAYQETLVKITKYNNIHDLNSFLKENYGINLRRYYSGSDRLERVDTEKV